MVKTLRFVEELRSSDPSLAELVQSWSHAFLSVFERWSRYDPSGAREALLDHSENPMQLRSLVAREKASRHTATSQLTQNDSGTLPISPHDDLPSLLNQAFQGGWEREPLRDILQQQPLHWRTQPSLRNASDVYRRSSGYSGKSRRPRLEWVKANELWRRRRVTAVALDDTLTPVAVAFEVKAYASWKLLRDRAPEFILRAYGLRRVVELVLIILPDLRAAEVFDRTDLGPDYANGSHDVWRFYRSS